MLATIAEGAAGAGAFESDEDEGSPFKPPNDEEVFLTRETEK